MACLRHVPISVGARVQSLHGAQGHCDSLLKRQKEVRGAKVNKKVMERNNIYYDDMIHDV